MEKGNDKFSECQRPFSPCWCETRPNNPHCNSIVSLPIESDLFSCLIIVAILIYLIKTKKTLKTEQNE